MAQLDRTRSHVGYVVAVMVAAVVALVLPTSPAQSFHTSEVTGIAARAYGLSASVGGIIPIAIPPSPDLSVSTPLCPANTSDAVVPVNVPTVLLVGVVEAQVYCPALPAPLASFLLPLAQADVANLILAPGVLGITPDVLSVEGVHAECSAGPTGPVGRATIATLEISGTPTLVDLANIAPNTTIDLPLLGLSIVLNQQFFVGGTLVVNAVHITTTAPILGIGPIDIVLAHAECAQILEPVPDSTTPTTPTTGPEPTTPTTQPCDGPCPTTPTTQPCNGPCPTTPTTQPCNGPCPTTPGATTTTVFRPGGGVLPGLPPGGGQGAVLIPGPTVVVPFVPQTIVIPAGVLARTGANAWNLLVLAGAALVIGTFLRRSSQATPLLPTEPVAGARQALARLAQRPSRKSW